MTLAFQILMVVLAVGLIVSTFWDSLLGWIKKVRAVRPVVVDNNWIDDIAEDTVAQKTELMMIVASWDNLRTRCDEAGLDEAVEELTLIWPLLVNRGVDNVEIS